MYFGHIKTRSFPNGASESVLTRPKCFSVQQPYPPSASESRSDVNQGCTQLPNPIGRGEIFSPMGTIPQAIRFAHEGMKIQRHNRYPNQPPHFAKCEGNLALKSELYTNAKNQTSPRFPSLHTRGRVPLVTCPSALPLYNIVISAAKSAPLT